MRFDSMPMAMVQTGSRTRIVHRPKVCIFSKDARSTEHDFLWVVIPPELRPVNLPVTYSPKSQQPVGQWKSFANDNEAMSTYNSFTAVLEKHILQCVNLRISLKSSSRTITV